MSNLKRRIAQLKIFRKVLESKGNISYDYSKCIYCGLCQKVCSVGAITVSMNPKN